jgi:hypothetical protein
MLIAQSAAVLHLYFWQVSAVWTAIFCTQPKDISHYIHRNGLQSRAFSVMRRAKKSANRALGSHRLCALCIRTVRLLMGWANAQRLVPIMGKGDLDALLDCIDIV